LTFALRSGQKLAHRKSGARKRDDTQMDFGAEAE
jgi:hypothetical protein